MLLTIYFIIHCKFPYILLYLQFSTVSLKFMSSLAISFDQCINMSVYLWPFMCVCIHIYIYTNISICIHTCIYIVCIYALCIWSFWEYTFSLATRPWCMDHQLTHFSWALVNDRIYFSLTKRRKCIDAQWYWLKNKQTNKIKGLQSRGEGFNHKV